MSITNSSAGRAVSGELNALLHQVEDIAALLNRYRQGKDPVVGATMFARLRAFVSNAAQDSGDQAERSFDSVMRAGEDLLDRARSSGAHGLDDVSGAVSRHPLTTILAAAGLGVALGMLLRRH